jgi:hypothetical protein
MLPFISCIRFVDALMKSILNRIMPLVAGGTITGIILIYSLGFLFVLVVNNIIWIIIAILLYKYYWRMNILEEVIILYILIFAKLKNILSFSNNKNN